MLGICPSAYKENTKKISLESKYKYMKNSMATGIAQKLQSFISIAVP